MTEKLLGGWDHDGRFFDLHWGGYEYSIEADRLDTMPKLLWWIHHLAEKNWPLMTARQIALFIEAVTKRGHWAMYQGES